MVAVASEGTGGTELLQKLPLVWREREDQKELHPGGGSRPSASLCLNLHAFACLVWKDAAGCFEGGKLKERWGILKSFLLAFLKGY